MDTVKRAFILAVLVAITITTPTPDCSPVPAIAAAHGCKAAGAP